MARAVRRRGRPRRSAGHGPVRGVHARGAARRARRLPAGPLERSPAARQCAARRRQRAADRDDARARGARGRAVRAAGGAVEARDERRSRSPWRRAWKPAAACCAAAELLEALGRAPRDSRPGRHALSGTHQARQVRRPRARGGRHRERGRPARDRPAAEGDAASERARRPLRRRALPGAARARQRARHQRLVRALPRAGTQARHAHPRQVGLGHLHHRAVGSIAQELHSSMR